MMKFLGIVISIASLYISEINSASLNYLNSGDSLIISEIMFYPVSGNNEFLEIYNLSSTESINLRNYQVKYYTSTPDSITDAGYGTILPPKSYAVILEWDYDFAGGIYNNIIPPEALKLKITSNSFGSNGMANTTSRPVWFISPVNDTLDCYFYSADNSPSISDEKKFLIKDSSSLNWSNSLLANGTPGFRNSVMPYQNNLRMIALDIYPSNPVSGDDLEFAAMFTNSGFSAAVNFTIELYYDINKDSIGVPSELIDSEIISSLHPGDTLTVPFIFNSVPAGDFIFIAKIDFSPDEFPSDNFIIKDLRVTQGIEFNKVVINEIMYAPQNGEPEWIEIYNNSTDIINLKRWRINDQSTSVLITGNNFYLNPGEYLLLAKDSSIQNYYPFSYKFIKLYLPSLNNTGDAIVLEDSAGTPSDSLFYFPGWGGTGNKSLERKYPSGFSDSEENWGTSANRFRGTPGFVNSITPKNLDVSAGLFITNQKYGIIGDEVNFQIFIKNNGQDILNNIELYLYHDKNADSVKDNNELISSSIVSEIFPGDSTLFQFRYSGYSEGINHFISYLNFEDEDTCNNTSFFSLRGVSVNFQRNDIVINEIMHSPEGEPEWLELYNKSSVSIDLKNFCIADGRDTVYLSKTSCQLLPEKYIVISSDSVLLTIRFIPSLFIKSSIPPFNNSGDRIMIIDSLGRIIDSLEYTSKWGGQIGYSLERKDIKSSSTDQTNWGSSGNKNKATPGYINSISPKLYDAVLNEIIFNPVYPVISDTVEIFYRIYNKGLTASEINYMLYRDSDNDSVADLLLGSGMVILEGEDSVIQSVYKVTNIKENWNLYGVVSAANDQDTSNNYMWEELKPGFKSGSIVINEIMYSPSSFEPEWIELYNRSTDIINIKDWGIKDVLVSPVIHRIPKDFLFRPFTYLVIASDSSIKDYYRVIPGDLIISRLPNLNNDREGVVLMDDRDIVIDSVFYVSSSVCNASLERISTDIPSTLSQNWGYSTDIELSTPGRINSITVKDYDLAVTGLYFMPQYPVINDTIAISAVIRNSGIRNAEEYSITFFVMTDTTEEIFASVTGNELIAGEVLSIQSPEKISGINYSMKLGVRIDFAPDQDTVNNYFERDVTPGEKEGSLVLNEVMYDPVNSSEWIEIYNPSGIPYNLKNWSISDLFPSPGKAILTSFDFYIMPGEYVVLLQDSSASLFFPDSIKTINAGFGALSSTGDGVILYDYRSGIIDSLRYYPAWGGRNGRSLERISINKATTDSSNWSTSLSPFKSTPGKKNSITDLPENIINSVVINEIMYDPDIDNCEFIELYNRSSNEINIGGWRIEDGSKNVFIVSDTSLFLEPRSFYTLAADSLILIKYYLNTNDIVRIFNQGTLGLSNSGETIIIKDLNGQVIDSIEYTPKYHNRNFLITKNRSLERISPEITGNDPFNWTSSTSISGATPGKMNSVFTEMAAAKTGISVSPNPFSPDNDGWEDHTIISYQLNINAPQLRLRIFDSVGRLVRTLAENFPSGSDGAIIFDGLDDQGRALRIGIYILLFEAFGISGSDIYKVPFVIARKL